MATSSRWKRFAFFERKNLSLPPSVVRDLIPATNNRGGGGGGGKGNQSRSSNTTSTSNEQQRRFDAPTRNNDNDEDGSLYPEDDGLINDDIENSGDYFSLVAASNVMLPPSLFSSRRGIASAAASAASKVSGDSNKQIEIDNDDNDDSDNIRGGGGATRRGAGGDGASAMHAALMALSTSANLTNDNSGRRSGAGTRQLRTTGASGAAGERDNNDNGLQLLFVSSRHTSHVHCVDVTVRCTPTNPRNSLATTTTNPAGASSSPDGNDNVYPRDDENIIGRRGSSNSNYTTSANAFASASTPHLGRSQSVPSDGNNNNAGAMSMMNLEELDGWRGHYDPFGSCGGYVVIGGASNVRNAVGGMPGGATSASSSSSSKPPPAPRQQASVSSTSTARRRTAAEQRILDEHLGPEDTLGGKGRDGGGISGADSGGGSGSLFGSSPFATDVRVEDTTRRMARVVGLATTTYHPPPPPPPPNNNKSQVPQTVPSSSSLPSSILYVATITDTPNTVGLVVHANPHLMLSSSLPPPSSSSAKSDAANAAASPRKGMYSCYYKPSSFDFATRGNPRCVSIMPGVVCVGTDTGVVLIYVFNCNIPPEIVGSNVVPSASGGSVGIDGGALTLVAEIPAPRSSIISGNDTEDDGVKNMYAVSSVQLIGPADTTAISSSSAAGGNTAGVTSVSGGASASSSSNIHRVFVSYRKRRVRSSTTSGGVGPSGSPKDDTASNNPTSSSSSGGVCCYELGGLRIPGKPVHQPPAGLSANAPVVSARYDMDGRDVGTNSLCDGVRLPPLPPAAVWMPSTSTAKMASKSGEKSSATDEGAAAAAARTNDRKLLPQYAVARNDGLHFYSPEEKVGVCPIDGNKIAVCALPPPPVAYLRRPMRPLGRNGDGGDGMDNGIVNGAGASYALVAATDSKSGRDSIDVYDTTNKLVGFHVLLSPGHHALRAVGVFSSPAVGCGKLIRGGRSSGIVLTSGGSIVSLTERVTPEKVDLLTQKNLYAAAISMAYSDPQFYSSEDIVALYRRYAEHLYRTGDFAAAMDQYILTIGSLESSHVIFRFLDGPKISLTVKYLEALRLAGLATSVHNELLRTCYLKLGDVDAASRIILASSTSSDAPAINPDGSEVPTVPISRNLLACADNPSEMLSAICSLNPPEAVKALVAHGVLIARSLPRETAGVVIALCDGSYSPTAIADMAAGRPTTSAEANNDSGGKCQKYPISLFANAFMENPKLFRLILSHCRRNDWELTPILRRTLLELTLDEWNAAKSSGDAQIQKQRHDEAIMMLSEKNHVEDIGDYEALVIVQSAGFTEGEILLYERLKMIPMLLEKYARSGTDRARRQMLALCEQHDPEILADVLSHFVSMARDRFDGTLKDESSVDSESEMGALLHDIQEALVMAREYGLPHVRILRILAGEGHGVFHSDRHGSNHSRCSVPLSAALDYVGAILDDSTKKIHRLKNNVEEYNRLCNEMENEINSLSISGSRGKSYEMNSSSALPNLDIDEMHAKLCRLEEEGTTWKAGVDGGFGHREQEIMREDFWREMENSENPFETICFFISKGYLDNI